MKSVLSGALLALSLLAIGCWSVLAGGVLDIGADGEHDAMVYRALEYAREQSIARRTAEIKVPADLDDPERLRRGSGNYQAMCVNCHLAPELPDSEIRLGLYPKPLNLSLKRDVSIPEKLAIRDFWIIKHGIMASGMPAWSLGGVSDDAIWDMVAFIGKMPLLSGSDYEKLLAASDGHSHDGMVGVAEIGESSPVSPLKDGTQEAKTPNTGKRHDHDHDSHQHGKHKH